MDSRLDEIRQRLEDGEYFECPGTIEWLLGEVERLKQEVPVSNLFNEIRIKDLVAERDRYREALEMASQCEQTTMGGNGNYYKVPSEIIEDALKEDEDEE